ncbi:MAG: hypothetical protein JWP42_954 [Pseudomonas sp.]|nr:hypothetical protein [Pseudomonas sp.]
MLAMNSWATRLSRRKRVIVDVHREQARSYNLNIARLIDDCRSELARDELIGDAFIQWRRVIVDVHRERARSYRWD